MYTGQWKETSDGIVNLDSLEPEVLGQAIRCLHARKLDVIQPPHQEDILFNIQLYLFGDSHLAGLLRGQAYQNCQEMFKQFKPELLDIASLELLADAAELVFSNTRRTDTDLRLLFLRFCAHIVWRLGYRLKDKAECSGDISQSLVAPTALSCSKTATSDSQATNVSFPEESPSKAPPSKETPRNPQNFRRKDCVQDNYLVKLLPE